MTEKEFQKELLSAFKDIGYPEEKRLESVSFVGEGAKHHTAKAVLYFSDTRRDSETAVIAIQETDDARNPNYKEQVKPYYALGTPIIVLAEYKKIYQGLEPQISVAGLNEESQFKIEKDNVIPFSKFKEYVKRNRENFSPRKLEDVKVDPSQSRKFKVEPYLFDRILKISDKELVQRYHSGLREVFNAYPKDTKEIYNYSLILLAARILRDKLTVEQKKTWAIDSIYSLIEGAREVNEYFHIPTKYEKILQPVMEFLPPHFNYSQLGIEALGHFYENAILSKETRQEFGVYYTPSIIAKTILKRMPIEEIRPENRILLDPTCGSGSFLVEGYERLTQATYLKVPIDERHRNLINTMYGNDIDGFAATIAKLTLLLFHPPHKNNWKVFSENGKDENFTKKMINKLGNKRPTIIVGNLPFKFEKTDIGRLYADNVKRSGHTQEGSEIILNNCLDLLEDKGLIGIILPEGILSHEESFARNLREKIYSNFQVLEQWSLPKKFFDAEHIAKVLILRKVKPTSFKIKNIEISLSDSVRKEQDIKGNAVISGLVDFDLKNIPKKISVIPLGNSHLFNKLASYKNKLFHFYDSFTGLEPYEEIRNGLNQGTNYITQKKISRVWTGEAKDKNQFTEIRKGKQCPFVDITNNDLFNRSREKTLQKDLLLNRPQVLMKRNRNNPKNWCSVALIDLLEENLESLATSDNFYATFLKLTEYEKYEKDYLVSLWVILNHPLVNLYVRNISPLLKITNSDYKHISLPDSWNDIEKIKQLASKAKQLLDLKRKYDSKYKSDDAANKSNISKSEEELRNKILSLVKETDKMIYDMYGFTNSEIRQIEDFFGSEKRPGLDELGEEWKQFKPVKKREKKEPSIDPSELKDFGTSFETLEIDYDKLQVKLIINGLRDREDGIDVDRDGIWIAITPYMPGWMLQVGANGMIYLKTYDSMLIQEFPEFFIKDFALMKNAYKTVEEIEENVFGKLTKQDKKVG
jgi:hypothetical protein